MLPAYRYQHPTGQPVSLQARHRRHAPVEDRIRCAKDTGIEHLPSMSFEINQPGVWRP